MSPEWTLGAGVVVPLHEPSKKKQRNDDLRVRRSLAVTLMPMKAFWEFPSRGAKVFFGDFGHDDDQLSCWPGRNVIVSP